MRKAKIKSIILFWIICAILFFVIKLSTSYLLSQTFSSSFSNPIIGEITNNSISVVISVFAGPIIETAIFFTLILSVLIYMRSKHILKKRIFILFLFLSSFLFSLNHIYSMVYFLTALVSGFLYALFYYKAYLKRYCPFIGVAIIHSLYNLFVFLWKH